MILWYSSVTFSKEGIVMITEAQLNLEVQIGYNSLSTHLETRNQIIDMMMRQYKDQLYSPNDIFNWYGIETWKDTKEQFQNLRFYHAEDFISYQLYLPQIFEQHEQYLSLDPISKAEILETLFLNRFYARLTTRAKLELLRELGKLYCQKHAIDSCKILATTTWQPYQAAMATVTATITVTTIDIKDAFITVPKDTLNHFHTSGIRALEGLYHELDHFYLFQKSQQGKLSKEEYIAYITSMDESSLLQKEDYIGYMFLPAEYRAALSSYQKVSQILKSNPYVNEQDEHWWEENQYITLRNLLLNFNIKHQVYLTEKQMTEFMESIAIEQFEIENKNCQLCLEKEEREKYREKAKKFHRICEKQK